MKFIIFRSSKTCLVPRPRLRSALEVRKNSQLLLKRGQGDRVNSGGSLLMSSVAVHTATYNRCSALPFALSAVYQLHPGV
jgi:hypothetical protein